MCKIRVAVVTVISWHDKCNGEAQVLNCVVSDHDSPKAQTGVSYSSADVKGICNADASQSYGLGPLARASNNACSTVK